MPLNARSNPGLFSWHLNVFNWRVKGLFMGLLTLFDSSFEGLLTVLDSSFKALRGS